MTYHNKNLPVHIDADARHKAIDELKVLVRDIPLGWERNLAYASLTLTSADRKRIIKIDSSCIYTVDVRQTDGSYKSSRFSCGNINEAWRMATQAIRAHKGIST